MSATVKHRKTMIRRAAQYMKSLRLRDAEYAESCEIDRKNGYRPHYCKHGRDMWTDYDNICQHCEDGYSNYEIALTSARSDVMEMERRTEWILAAPKENMPRELFAELLNWACEPITSEV